MKWGLFSKHNKPFFDPDETFLDSRNLPEFDNARFEGVLEKPISPKIVYGLGFIFISIFVIFLAKSFSIQIIDGERMLALSQNNNLKHSAVFAERGVIYDRNNEELVWNAEHRSYANVNGLSHILGYVSFPTKEEITDFSYNPKEFVGRDGVEKIFNDVLRGVNGIKIIEVDAVGEEQSGTIISEPEHGDNLYLSIDSRIQEKMFETIRGLAIDRNFLGGAGIIMDIYTGEIVALTNYPEYDSSVLALGEDTYTISSYQTDSRKPFLNRSLQGLYTPGSIFKPIVAAAALEEGVITPEKIIYTDGSLRFPNPYVPGEFTIFRDWQNNGPVDLYDALAVSSNVYFFQVGGGFEGQRGIGIANISKYAKMFGLGNTTNSGFLGESSGVIPDPAWKEKTFGEEWRIGDTYNTSIGQYSSQVTPIQIVRAISAIANGGTLIDPVFEKEEQGDSSSIPIAQENLLAVRRGMRQAVESGTATGLSIPGFRIAAKTGTAEIDFGKKFVNSWVTGFFPYEQPRYAFVFVMEKGPRDNYIGGVFAARQVLEWMHINTPEYTEIK